MATHDGVDVIEVAENTFAKTRNMRISDEDNRDEDDESESEGKLILKFPLLTTSLCDMSKVHRKGLDKERL